MNDLFGGSLPISSKPVQRKAAPKATAPMVFASQAEQDAVDEALRWMSGYHVCPYPLTEAQAALLLHLRNNPKVTSRDVQRWGDDFERLLKLDVIRFTNSGFPLVVQLGDGFWNVWRETDRRILNWCS